MSNYSQIQQTTVFGNRFVRPGDEVALRRPDQYKPDPECGDYFARQQHALLREWLGGEGPFTIARMAQWACGRVMLYLNGQNGQEIGVYAVDFQ